MRALFLLLAMLLLQGCQYDPFAHFYTTKRPKTEDIPGTYTLFRQTVDETHPSILEGKLCLLELHPDGTFMASNIPPASINTPSINFFDTLTNISGTWSLDTLGTVDGGDNQPGHVWGIHLATTNSELQPMRLASNEPPYGLICTLGDPDAGQAMLFTKQFPPGSTNGPDMDPFTLDEISDGVPGISFLFVIVLILILLLLFALALVVGVVLLVLGTILISLGVLSTSVLVGFLQRSPASGFRALFLQLGAIAGTACGIGATWLVSLAADAQWHPLAIILVGGLTGLCFGLLIAFLFNLAWSRGVNWLLNCSAKTRAVSDPSTTSGNLPPPNLNPD